MLLNPLFSNSALHLCPHIHLVPLSSATGGFAFFCCVVMLVHGSLSVILCFADESANESEETAILESSVSSAPPSKRFKSQHSSSNEDPEFLELFDAFQDQASSNVEQKQSSIQQEAQKWLERKAQDDLKEAGISDEKLSDPSVILLFWNMLNVTTLDFHVGLAMFYLFVPRVQLLSECGTEPS